MNRLSMFVKKKGLPCLRGRAAEVKHFGKALESTWRKHMNPNLEIHQKVALMLKMNNQVETLLDKHKGKFRVPQPDALSLETNAFAAMQLQQELRQFFADADQPLFNVTSKSHFLLHSVMSAVFMHPHLSWCYRGEDFMRLWQRLGKNSVRGRSAPLAMHAMCQHFSIGTHMDWT